MKILITGAKGFVGRNLAETLRNVRDGKDKSRGEFDEINIYEYDVDTAPELLEKFCAECDFVVPPCRRKPPQGGKGIYGG